MSKRRQLQFLSQVADAAQNASVVKPRGRPVPKNLTEEGRRMGLEAMKAVPRCRAERRDGQPCRKPAMRGATRCLTHGGRTEVPGHPANIRRFLSGQMHRSLERQEAYL